jgi:hypothetical protein
MKILMRADKYGTLMYGDEDICPGIHFCPDWNDLPVFAGIPEADACQCGRLPKSEDEKPHSGADEPAEQETSA